MKRLAFYGIESVPVEHHNGMYVRYSDALAALTEARERVCPYVVTGQEHSSYCKLAEDSVKALTNRAEQAERRVKELEAIIEEYPTRVPPQKWLAEQQRAEVAERERDENRRLFLDAKARAESALDQLAEAQGRIKELEDTLESDNHMDAELWTLLNETCAIIKRQDELPETWYPSPAERARLSGAMKAVTEAQAEVAAYKRTTEYEYLTEITNRLNQRQWQVERIVDVLEGNEPSKETLEECEVVAGVWKLRTEAGWLAIDLEGAKGALRAMLETTQRWTAGRFNGDVDDFLSARRAAYQALAPRAQGGEHGSPST